MTARTPEASAGGRSPFVRVLALGLALLLIAAFVALGSWQVQRLFWKHDLIARIDSRVHAEAVAPPSRAEWPRINATNDEYRRIRAAGVFDHAAETFVYAVTELGAGYWVMTPLRLADGTAILVNRGFVPGGKRDPSTRTEGQVAGPVKVTGLMRMSEAKGTLLRANRPEEDRWYSRDVAAIAAKHHVADAAPYFIDADSTPNPGGAPVGGLTRIALPDNHLVYALTWYAMALCLGGALVYVVRRKGGS